MLVQQNLEPWALKIPGVVNGGGDDQRGGWISADGQWAGGYDVNKGWGLKTPYGKIGGNDQVVGWKNGNGGGYINISQLQDLEPWQVNLPNGVVRGQDTDNSSSIGWRTGDKNSVSMGYSSVSWSDLQELAPWHVNLPGVASGGGDEIRGGIASADGQWAAGYDVNKGWGAISPYGAIGGNELGVGGITADKSKGGWVSADGQWAGGWDAAKGWALTTPHGAIRGRMRDCGNCMEYEFTSPHASGQGVVTFHQLMDLEPWSVNIPGVVAGGGDENRGGWKSADGQWAGGYDVNKGWGMVTPFGGIGGNGQVTGGISADGKHGGFISSCGEWCGFFSNNVWGLRTPHGKIAGKALDCGNCHAYKFTSKHVSGKGVITLHPQKLLI